MVFKYRYHIVFCWDGTKGRTAVKQHVEVNASSKNQNKHPYKMYNVPALKKQAWRQQLCSILSQSLCWAHSPTWSPSFPLLFTWPCKELSQYTELVIKSNKTKELLSFCCSAPWTGSEQHPVSPRAGERREAARQPHPRYIAVTRCVSLCLSHKICISKLLWNKRCCGQQRVCVFGGWTGGRDLNRCKFVF